jgi:hypothetical protein
MTRSRAARFGALLLSLAMVGTSFAACSYKDPPAADLITEKFSLGPFDLAPDGTSGDRAQGWRTMARPAGDIAVKTIRWKVLDGADNEIPSTDHRIHFHHVVAYSTRHRDPTCPYSVGGERWAAPGSERTPLLMPDGYAYFAGAGDVWTGNYDIMNLTDEPQTGIHVTYDITYTRNRSTLHDVQPYWLDLAKCTPAGTIAIPGGGEPGSVYSKSETFTLPYLGVVVGVRSHLHDGGIDVTTADPDGNVICRGAAVYTEDDGGGGGHEHSHESTNSDGHATSGPRIKEIPFCANLNVAVNAGEKITVTARYHNEQTLDDAMGKVIVYVGESRPATPAPGSSTPRTTSPATTSPEITSPATTSPGPATTSPAPTTTQPPPSVPPTREPVTVPPAGTLARPPGDGGGPDAWPNFPYPPQDGSTPDWPHAEPPVGIPLPAD